MRDIPVINEDSMIRFFSSYEVLFILHSLHIDVGSSQVPAFNFVRFAETICLIRSRHQKARNGSDYHSSTVSPENSIFRVQKQKRQQLSSVSFPLQPCQRHPSWNMQDIMASQAITGRKTSSEACWAATLTILDTNQLKRPPRRFTPTFRLSFLPSKSQNYSSVER